MAMRVDSTRLHDFFLTMARKSFRELGVGDEAIVGYVAAMMAEFTRADRLYAMGAGAGLETVASALTESGRSARDARSLARAREIRKYVGDYTLFMSGIFRTHVERTGSLDDYLARGQRSYWAVSELDLSLLRTGFVLFQQLSRNFEFYSGALDYMRKAYFVARPGSGASPFAEFLEQVRGWITGGLSDN